MADTTISPRETNSATTDGSQADAADAGAFNDAVTAAKASNASDGTSTRADRPNLLDIYTEFQVEDDPDGLIDWEPTGGPGEAVIRAITDPREVTATEGRLLDDLSLGDKFRLGIPSENAEFLADTLYPPLTERRRDFAIDGQFERWTREGGHNDAFRHIYASALATKNFGADFASRYTTAHEQTPKNPAEMEAMDLFNNGVGRRIAARNPGATDQQLAAEARKAVEKGEAVVIDSNGELAWSDDVPYGQHMPDYFTGGPDYSVGFPGGPPADFIDETSPSRPGPSSPPAATPPAVAPQPETNVAPKPETNPEPELPPESAPPPSTPAAQPPAKEASKPEPQTPVVREVGVSGTSPNDESGGVKEVWTEDELRDLYNPPPREKKDDDDDADASEQGGGSGGSEMPSRVDDPQAGTGPSYPRYASNGAGARRPGEGGPIIDVGNFDGVIDIDAIYGRSNGAAVTRPVEGGPIYGVDNFNGVTLDAGNYDHGAGAINPGRGDVADPAPRGGAMPRGPNPDIMMEDLDAMIEGFGRSALG